MCLIIDRETDRVDEATFMPKERTKATSLIKSSTLVVLEAGPLQYSTEPVFLNVFGGQESIPRNEFRQPM